LDRRSRVTREEDDIPAVVTHGGRPIATVPTVRASNYGSCGERMQWSERRRAFVCYVRAREIEAGKGRRCLVSGHGESTITASHDFSGTGIGKMSAPTLNDEPDSAALYGTLSLTAETTS
jgi:hypothetical protein